MSEQTIQELIAIITASFLPEKAAGVNTCFQIILSGEQGGEWGVTIKDQTCTVTPGVLPDPRLTIRAAAQDVLDIFNGKTDATAAYMQGRVQFNGDMGLLFRLSRYFKTG